MKNKLYISLTAGIFFLATAAVLCAPSRAICYGVSYNYYVHATGSDGIPIMDNGTLNGQAQLYETYTKTGNPDAGNYGHVNYYANLHTGSIGAYSSAAGGVTGYYPYGFTGTGRTEKIGFFIYLYFTVPAGYYEDGVTVGVSGVARGNLSSTEAAGVHGRYSISFGSASAAPDLMEVGIDEAGEINFIHPFDLNKKIVNDGATLGEATEYQVNLQAYIYNNDAWAVLFGYSPNYTTGSAVIDFYSGIQFSSVNVPEGVTWDSESSVFLDQVPTDSDDPAKPSLATCLYQNYPNPFNPVTTITYYLAEPGRVRLSLYDVNGKLVRKLESGRLAGEGDHEVIWNGRDDAGRDLASGVYFYRLETGSFSNTKKMVKLR